MALDTKLTPHQSSVTAKPAQYSTAASPLMTEYVKTVTQTALKAEEYNATMKDVAAVEVVAAEVDVAVVMIGIPAALPSTQLSTLN